MLIPPLKTGMEQQDNRSTFRIDGRQVRPLVQIAMMASQRQVRLDAVVAVLTSGDVLDVKVENRLRILANMTIFATVAGSIAN